METSHPKFESPSNFLESKKVQPTAIIVPKKQLADIYCAKKQVANNYCANRQQILTQRDSTLIFMSLFHIERPNADSQTIQSQKITWTQSINISWHWQANGTRFDVPDTINQHDNGRRTMQQTAEIRRLNSTSISTSFKFGSASRGVRVGWISMNSRFR